MSALPASVGLPDPSELYAVADRIAAHARTVHARADLLQRDLEDLQWQGSAAATFHAASSAIVHGLRVCAARLGDAADALRRHARVVQRRLDLLEHVRSVLLGVGVDVTHLLVDGVVSPLDLLDHAGALLDHAGGMVDDVARDAGGVVRHAGGVVETILGIG